MGIHDLWKIIGDSQKKFTLEQLASDRSNKKKGKGLRVAIDVALWIFQVKTSVAESSVAGDKSELRVIFFRLCRLYELGIRPVFVFDGPNRPAYKRNRVISTAPLESHFQTSLTALIRYFNFSIWDAYGDAEAECAVLQRLGFVDVVMTGDSDVFLFGAGRVIKQWPNKRNDPVECYDLRWIEDEVGIDRSDMILIALLRGSDYDTQGTQGIGIQLATGLAKCRYHRELFEDIQRGGCGQPLDENKVNQLYDRLTYELHHNTQKKIHKRHTTIRLNPKFPNFFVVTDFILPKVHIQDSNYIDKARELNINLDRYCDPDWESLAPFVQHAFKWPVDYALKRLSLLTFPGYMANILRRQQFNDNKPKIPTIPSSQKAKHQTRLDDYYKLTSRYRTKPNEMIKKITTSKVMSNTVKLYRVEWNQAHLREFQNLIMPKLDKEAYKDIIPNEGDEEEQENVWNNVKRQWVNATLIHNVSPSLAMAYQTAKKDKVGAFLIKPARRCTGS